MNLTKTSITRATAQLEGMGLIRQMKSRTEIAIKRNYSRKEYYENAKAYLINPVRKRLQLCDVKQPLNHLAQEKPLLVRSQN